MIFSIKHIASVINANAEINHATEIEYLLIDSRKIIFPSTSLFFALHGPRRDGHQFITEVYERGIRNFVVKKGFNSSSFIDANFLLVDDVLQALQTLAAFHRTQFSIPVIGITGSNGKTVVKEWLYQLLQQDQNIVRSPRSYNSQVGVPLSVWQINQKNTLGIFEAGISTVDEMQNLEKIIRPTIGILTNIGEAHNEGFSNEAEKIKEKLKLFSNCEQLIYPKDTLPKEVDLPKIKLFSWSRKYKRATVFIEQETKTSGATSIILVYQNQSYQITVPFVDNASIDNAITCYCVLLSLGYANDIIAKRLLHLLPVEMRLQLKKGVNNCSILNDSYSNDISSLNIALDYLTQQSGKNTTTVILSDIFQSGLHDAELYKQVAVQLQQRGIHKLIGIGENISKQHLSFIKIPETGFYSSTEQFLEHSNLHQFKDEFILLKGARLFAFERISKWLEQKVHQTVLEINLSAIAHNLKEYQKHLLPSTKVMAMVKAYSYGSGAVEVARVLQFCKVDYLAVAYTDEGIELRKAGISLPIMVMNADEHSFDSLVEYNLEPEIYSLHIFHSFHQYLQRQAVKEFPIHIKLNTGMNRLGFDTPEIKELSVQLKNQNTMMVKSVFSHLAASENAEHDGFTKHQSDSFEETCSIIEKNIGYSFIKHIANSAGIFRHPNLQFDIVRLGIGLYGVDSADEHILNLEPVATLRSTIAQIRKVKAGETIGYNRNGKVNRDSLIAIVRIGYADGFSRRLGNGVGSIYVNGQLTKVVGNVCMDMMMIDVTEIENVKEGDVVEIFGKHLPIQKIAEWSDTIAYEVMTSVSQRVKRIYVEE